MRLWNNTQILPAERGAKRPRRPLFSVPARPMRRSSRPLRKPRPFILQTAGTPFADWLEASKAADVTVIDVTGLNPCMDALIVATATSARHARALADGLLEQSRLHEYEYLRMEGYQAGQWVLVDLNDVVVHLFLTETRELYRIEALWRDAPFLRSPAPARQAADGPDDPDGMKRIHAAPAENVF